MPWRWRLHLDAFILLGHQWCDQPLCHESQVRGTKDIMVHYLVTSPNELRVMSPVPTSKSKQNGISDIVEWFHGGKVSMGSEDRHCYDNDVTYPCLGWIVYRLESNRSFEISHKFTRIYTWICPFVLFLEPNSQIYSTGRKSIQHYDIGFWIDLIDYPPKGTGWKGISCYHTNSVRHKF